MHIGDCILLVCLGGSFLPENHPAELYPAVPEGKSHDTTRTNMLKYLSDASFFFLFTTYNLHAVSVLSFVSCPLVVTSPSRVLLSLSHASSRRPHRMWPLLPPSFAA